MCYQQDQYYSHLNKEGICEIKDEYQNGSNHTLAEDSSVSLASDASSCAKITPPSSFSRLRRSTFDLSDCLANSSFSSSSGNSLSSPPSLLSSPSRKSKTTVRCNPSPQETGAATLALLKLASKEALLLQSRGPSSSPCSIEPLMMDDTRGRAATSAAGAAMATRGHDGLGTWEFFLEEFFVGILLSFLHAVVQVERHVRRLVRDFHQCAPSIVTQLTSIFPKFEEPLSKHFNESGSFDSREDSSVSTNGLSETSTDMVREAILHEQEKSMNDDDLLTSMKLSFPSPAEGLAGIATTRDEWGHFADFREELADEACFIPSCAGAVASRPPTATPAPLMTAIAQPQQGLQGLSALATLPEECDDDDEEEDSDWSF